MFKKLIRTTWTLLIIVGLLGLIPAAALAAPPHQQAGACEQEYTVQAGDWLSKIAEDFYSDVSAYPAIRQATNAQAETGDFQQIEDPNTIEVGWTLCIPSQSETEMMVGATDQMGQSDQMAEPALTAPQGEMLLVIRNQSKANAPSTFTISGGEFAGGEQITVNHGEEVQLNLMPADYRVTWSSPASEDIAFTRDFTAVAGTVAQARIIPEKEQVFFNFNVNQQQLSEEQAQQMSRPEEQYTAPQGEMLLVLHNYSKANAPSTFTIAGEEFAGGEQITVNHGEEVQLELMPGEYRLTWSSPAAEELSFSRTLTAIPGTVTSARIIPEKEQVFFRSKVNQEQMMDGQTGEMQEATSEMAQQFPYEAPEGRALLAFGNRSKANIPSTLTITGGRFAGGEQFTVNPGDETTLAVDPGTFTVQWSAPVAEEGSDEGETVIVSRETQVVAGESALLWIVPEEFRAFMQTPGEAPMELAQ